MWVATCSTSRDRTLASQSRRRSPRSRPLSSSRRRSLSNSECALHAFSIHTVPVIANWCHHLALLNSDEFLVCNRQWDNRTSFWWSATIRCTRRCGADTAPSSAVFVVWASYWCTNPFCVVCARVLFSFTICARNPKRFQSLFTISIWQSVPRRPDLERSWRASARWRRRAAAAAGRVPLRGQRDGLARVRQPAHHRGQAVPAVRHPRASGGPLHAAPPYVNLLLCTHMYSTCVCYLLFTRTIFLSSLLR